MRRVPLHGIDPMYVQSPEPGADFLLSRRLFLGACSVLAVSLAACRSVGPRTSFAARMLADPPEREYGPVLRGLVRTILPFEDARFPADPGVIDQRLLELFPVHDGDRFLGLQRALMFFDDIDLFPHVFGPLARAETVADETAGAALPRDGGIDRLRLEEEGLYRRFRDSVPGTPRRFTTLGLGDQRAYLRMWGASAFTTKRQFARSAKSLVMITAYSTEELWRTISYAGPTLEGDRAPS